MGKQARILSAGAVMGIAAVVLMATAVHALVYDPSPEIAPPPGLSLPDVPPTDYPETLSIPSAQISAPVEAVGITDGDRMATSAKFTDVGWYEYGPVPGEIGTAVIEGHLDNGLGLDGAFRHLADAQVGDDIDVTTKDGQTLHFTVTDVETYPYEDVPTGTLFGTGAEDGKAHLNLVTCAGNWTYNDAEGMTYDHRLVVFATETGAS